MEKRAPTCSRTPLMSLPSAMPGDRHCEGRSTPDGPPKSQKGRDYSPMYAAYRFCCSHNADEPRQKLPLSATES